MGIRCRFDDLCAGTALELARPVGELTASRLEDVTAVLAEVDTQVRRGRHAAGFVAYEAAPAFDRALTVKDPTGASPLPLVWFGLFADAHPVAVVDPLGCAPVGQWTSDLDEASHAAAVRRIRREIEGGWTYQVNLTTMWRRGWAGDPYLLYRQLAAAQAGAHHGYLETDDWAVACGSPELFFTLESGCVVTRPMKGTARRGRFGAEDADQAARLRSSPKEQAENLMIVDLLRNDLGRIAEIGSVTVPSLHELERNPSVWQLTSTVSARVPPATGIAPLFGSLFPCGSVTGAPKASTMALIAELERAPRGPYCGAVGRVAPTDRGPVARFAVGIRTAVVDRGVGVASFGAGGAITWDSQSAEEWAELQAKHCVVVQSSPRFRLLETLRLDEAGELVNLRAHLKRLAASADYFGYELAEAGVVSSLRRVVAELDGPQRVRVLVARDGGLVVEAAPLAAEAPGPVRLEIDDEPVDASDVFLFHKTTLRARYDERAARHLDADDVVLVNGRGEVTETTRANLLALIDGAWCTPPLGCGLLPGIGRAALIADGTVTERVITVAELETADEVETVSSLRGRLPAVVLSRCSNSPGGDARKRPIDAGSGLRAGARALSGYPA